MSEAATEQPTAETPAETPGTEAGVVTPSTETPESKPTETVDFWKKQARENEKRAKDNADAAKKLAELEESQKTEAQKIADRASAAERARDEAVADGLRYKAAARHGVDEDHFDLLGSGDEETITARAERVGGLLKLRTENDRLTAELEALKAGKPAPSNGRPTEALRPGAVPSAPSHVADDSYPSHWLPQR